MSVSNPLRTALLGALLLPLHVFASTAAAGTPACVALGTSGLAVTQDFDTLANTGTLNTTLPAGWYLAESGANANGMYQAGTGSGNSGDTFSFGAMNSTERAFGGLFSGNLTPTIGACFVNNTGAAITSLGVAYTGEHWRLGTAGRDDRIDFQISTDATSLTTGTYTDVDALDFVTPVNTGSTGARDGNVAPNRTAVASSIGSLSIANGATFWIRWNDFNAANADDGLSVDDFSITANPSGGATPALSVNDVSQAEGDAATSTFSFTVSLSAPAGASGVSFDIATADGTATTGNSDYVARSLTGQTVPAGSSTYTFDVTVNGDTTTEPDETFFVNVTNVTGATVADAQGQGTIVNDDVTVVAIHDIQGSGAASPLVGMMVTTRGIVTGRKNNGFFIQEPDAGADGDPATSEGIFVFTAGAPPASAAIGNLVQVAATVVEFVPSQDPLQSPLSELSFATVTELSTGNPLPAPTVLTTAFPDPAGAFDQLERLEGMRVSAASFTTNGGTLGSVNEPNATATSNGIFHVRVTGVPRAFREPGIEAPNPAPQGTIPPIPRWDSNPELLAVDSDAQGNTQLNPNAGAVVTGVVGPLDYTFRRYTILQDGGATPAPMFSGGQIPTPVSVPAPAEFTIAAYNLERFFDTVNDPGSEPVLTTVAFDNRLNKASLGIRNFLRTPDILGVVEMENLSTLQSLAARISSDAVAASQPDPMYQAYLIEGNDIGGIDVGFLVKTAPVAGATPRVTVNAVVQELDASVLVNPDMSTSILNDRPPLRLDAVVNSAGGGTFPVTVIVNHMRSLGGVEDTSPGSNGWATGGERVRAKRQAQAEDLANLVQARQIANSNERIVLIGDFNAFEFNDGLVDSMSVIAGTPTPDNQTAVPGDGIDLVNPDFSLLLDSAGQRYSFVFGGNAQSLDHLLVNQAMIAATSARRVEHPRINADFAETERNNSTTATRLADHDPLVGFFGSAGLASADLSVTISDSPDPVLPGADLTYTVVVTNSGPDSAINARLDFSASLGSPFVSTTPAPGWTCVPQLPPPTSPPPPVNGRTCTIPVMPTGAATFTFVISVPQGSFIALTASAVVSSETTDPNSANDSAIELTDVIPTADLSISKTDSPDPVLAGGNINYTITAANAGPSAASSVAVSDPLPVGTTFVSLASPAGWTCTTPAVGSNGTVNCTNPTLASAGNAVFTLVAQVDAANANASVITNTAAIASTTSDPSMANNTATATTTVNAGVLITGTKTASGPFTPGGTFTYTIVLRNPSGGNQLDNPGNEFTDVLPAPLELVSATSTSGTTVANVGTRTVTFNGAIPAGGSVTITITARIPATVAEATVISNQGTFAFDADANGTNESSGVTDDPGTGAAGDATQIVVGGGIASGIPIPTLSPALLAFLALLLGTLGLRATARRD